MGHSQAEKAETHRRIVEVAAKRFRELGLHGISVADVMKEVGITVGGFYKHFSSREDLVIQAVELAIKELDAWDESVDNVPLLIRTYLSEEHRDCLGSGCVIGALVGDISRSSPAVKDIYTKRAKRTVSFIETLLEGDDPAEKHAFAIFIQSSCVGALSLARAMSDPQYSKQILHSVAEQLVSTVNARNDNLATR